MYGWRARIGLLVPSLNITMESEFYRMVPEGVSVHTSRVRARDTQKADEIIATLLEMSKDIERAAIDLSTAKVNVIVYGCTSGSLIKGISYDKEIINKIMHATGIEATTTATDVVEAIKELGIKKIGIATPYIDDINKKEKEFLESNVPRLKVVKLKGLGIASGFAKAELSPSVAYNLARLVDGPEVDGIFISCTNFRTIDIIDKIEKDLKKPVISSNQASMWSALRKTNVHESIKGYGQLLEKHF